MEGNIVHYDWALWYYWYIVLFGFAEILNFVVFGSFIATGVLLAFMFLMYIDNENINYKGIGKYVKVAVAVFVISKVLLSFIPDKHEMRNMIALVGVETTLKNERTQKIAGKSVQVLEKYLDKLSKDN